MPKVYTNGRKYVKGSNLFFIAEALKTVIRNRSRTPTTELKTRIDALRLLGELDGAWEAKALDIDKPEKPERVEKPKVEKIEKMQIDAEAALKRLAEGGEDASTNTTDSEVGAREGIQQAVDEQGSSNLPG